MKKNLSILFLLISISFSFAKSIDVTAQQVFANIEWATKNGVVLEKIENVSFVDKTGTQKTGILEIIKQEDEKLGVRVVNATDNIGLYSSSIIAQQAGFIDLLPNLLQKEGLTLDDFHYMMQKNVNALTDAEKIKLTNIRNALPKPDANTLMQKAIPQRDIIKYLSGQYKEFGGFVSRASDAKHLKNFEDIYNGLRLDYSGTTFFVEEGSCGLIRFKSTDIPSKIVIPKGGTFDTYDYPFTSTGFTSGKQGRLGIPELNLTERIKFSNGDEIWEVLNNGTEKLRAVYNKDLQKFIIVE